MPKKPSSVTSQNKKYFPGKLRGKIVQRGSGENVYYEFLYTHYGLGYKLARRKKFFVQQYGSKEVALKSAKLHQLILLTHLDVLTNMYKFKDDYVKMTPGEWGTHAQHNRGETKFLFDSEDLPLVKKHFWTWDGRRVYTRLGKHSKEVELPNFLAGPGIIDYKNGALDCRRSQFKVYKTKVRKITPLWRGNGYEVRVRRADLKIRKVFSLREHGSNDMALRQAEKFIRNLEKESSI